jgi:pimeloyl-ACP methyl ester carboxylesterase
VILIGHSWGAWLGAMVTARYPALIRKLILVSSGVFEEEYATIGWQTRMNRLTTGEQERVKTLLDQMNDPGIHQKDDLLAEFGKIKGGNRFVS